MQATSILGASLNQRGAIGSLQNLAYQKIKEKIVTGQIQPASMIDDKALAAELKLGYTPIRQALRWLALENLVVILPRRATMVADVNVSDLQKVYEIRIDLLPYAYSLAARRCTLRQIAEMEDFLTKSKGVIAKGEASVLLAVDRTMQTLAIRATQNEFLIEILERLHSQAMRFWRTDRINEADLRKQVGQHRQIVVAFKRRDGRTASRLIRGIVKNFNHSQNEVL